METITARHCHHLPAEEVVDLLSSNATSGLDAFEVTHRLRQFGPNRITPSKGKGPLLRFLLQFHQPLVYILLVSAAVTALLKEGVDAAVIFGVVLVNAIIGFIQENRAAQAIQALARSVSTEATVIRSGRQSRVPSVDLVLGDLVLLQSGDKVPADLRLIGLRDLKIDESVLTGESAPVSKAETVLPRDTVLADRRNMAYASTLVTYGQATGIVIATGDNTEVGRISELIHQADDLATPLTRKIAHLSHLLLVLILIMAGLAFGLGMLRGEPASEVFMSAVALAVGAIPEGLPAAVTVTLAIGVSRMARRRAIIRRLPAVETLGSTTVICSDKTGTLTENQMTVRSVWASGNEYEVTGAGYSPTGQIRRNGQDVTDAGTALRECLVAGVLCNDAQLVEMQGRWQILGDPTEGALIVSSEKLGLNREQLAARLPRVDTIPFESQHQYMATLHDTDDDMRRRVYLKGAVERVLERCTNMLSDDGTTTPLDTDTVLRQVDRMAAGGLRVLAMARGEMPPNASRIEHTDLSAGMTFLGIQGMIDPPRAEAIKSVALCQAAGIEVKMITGDHAVTAAAIAAQLGLNRTPQGEPHPLEAITGQELSRRSDSDLVDLVERTSVFARVSPEQKLRLVEALQTRGHVVAMTGDGVNDAPALKQANIGVAMGITGTEVAKEAADMILTDDNFATIEAAVEEGRGVFDNLTKFIAWTLPTNMGEGLVILAAILMGAQLPIMPVQLLWINMTTAILLGMMLAFEPKEAGLMSRPPRDPKARILTTELLLRILSVSAMLLLGAFGLFEWEVSRGMPIAEARTTVVNVFILVEVAYLFNCRSLTRSARQIGLFSNPWVILGSVAMLSIQVCFCYVPAMNRMFHTAPVDGTSWLEVAAIAIIAYALVGLEKWLRYRGPSNARAR